MKAKILFAIVGLIVFCSWATQQKNEIKKAEWLIGIWENKTPQGSIYESWSKISDNELLGKSYLLKEKDTVVFENIRLVQEEDHLYYIPTVETQNNALPARFALKTISDTSLVFENPTHDFPQLIAYTRIHADSLLAEISGIKNGETQKRTFPMKRFK